MRPDENAPARPKAKGSNPDDSDQRFASEVSRYVLTPSDLAQDSPQWRVLRPGVRILDLFEGSSLCIALLSYTPGARVPLHVHTGDEHIFVLQGSQSDEHGDYKAGSYVFNPAGSRHSVHSREGCVVLIQWRAPVAFVDSDQNENE